MPFADFFLRVAKHWNRRTPSTKISARIAFWFGLAEEMRSMLLNREPVVTRQIAALAAHSFPYDNSKVQRLTGIQFRNIDDTISWCCENYVKNVKTD